MPVQKWSDRIWVVQANPDPMFTEDIDYLHDRAPVQGSMPDVVIDLSGVESLNSSNLSQLLRLRKTLQDSSARLRLAAPSDAAWAVFLSTGLDKLFDFKSDTTTALADLQIEKR